MAADKNFTLATRLLLTHVFQSDNIDEAFAAGLDVMVDSFNSESGTIWILNRKRDRLLPASHMGPTDISNVSVRMGSGVVGTVASSQQAILIPDLDNKAYSIAPEEASGQTVFSLMCVPLICNKVIVGCIELINKKDGAFFSSNDIELLEHLAYLMAMAVDDKGFPLIAEEPKDVLISIRDLKKDYENGESKLHVLKGLNLDIYKNEFLVILGESGCGKSTLMNIIGGMDTLTSGTVLVEGRDVSHLTEHELTLYRREFLGFVFQAYNLMPNLTALENVRYIAELVDNPMRPEDAIDKVKLSAKAGFYPGQMSGGQQQRVSIARAIVKNPKLILADEPTAALDYQTSIEVLSVIEDVVKTKGTTIVMITHNTQIAKMADRVVTMRNGVVANIKHNLTPCSATDLVW